MQISSCSITPKYISWRELHSLSITVKLGSSESISNSGGEGNLVCNWMFNNYVDDTASRPGTQFAWENFSISKGGSKSFSASGTGPWESESLLTAWINRTSDKGQARIYPIGVWANITGSNTVDGYESTRSNIGYFLLSRLDPVINSHTCEDTHPLNPPAHFGAFVQHRSIPRLAFDTTLDPLDPTLTATHKLILTLPDESEQELESPDGVFLLDAPSQSGTYRWTYTITDSTGRSATESGTFEVLAYAPPRIDALYLQRYTESVDDEGRPVYTATADGDRIWITVDATVAPVEGLNAWTLKRTREDMQTPLTLLSGDDGEHIARIDDRSLDTSIYSPTNSIGVTVTLTDFFETVERYEVILKAGAYFHVTPDGVAVGMRSTATPEHKKFEVAEGYKAYFYGGGGIQLDPIWEHPEASSGKQITSMAAQTINLNRDLSNYDAFVVKVVRMGTSDLSNYVIDTFTGWRYSNFDFVRIGMQFTISNASGRLYCRERVVYVNSLENAVLSIQNSTQDGAANGGALIPIALYGLKL